MKPETIDTITRHLKGIVAALEKERASYVSLNEIPAPSRISERFNNDVKDMLTK